MSADTLVIETYILSSSNKSKSCVAHFRAYKLHWYEKQATNSNFMTTMQQQLNDLSPLETQLTDEVYNESIWSLKSYGFAYAFATAQKSQTQ